MTLFFHHRWKAVLCYEHHLFRNPPSYFMTTETVTTAFRWSLAGFTVFCTNPSKCCNATTLENVFELKMPQQVQLAYTQLAVLIVLCSDSGLCQQSPHTSSPHTCIL